METGTRAVSALRGTNQRWWNEERSIHIASIPVVSTQVELNLSIQNCVLQTTRYVIIGRIEIRGREAFSTRSRGNTRGVCSCLFLSPRRSELDTVR